MTEAERDRLDQLTAEMRAAAVAGDPFREATADTEFHRLIMHHSGNATLERVWSTLEPFLRTYITIVSPGVDRRAVADRHLPIIEALRRQNPALIEEAFRIHFEQAANALAEVWPHHSGDPSDRGRSEGMPAIAI
jgi:DNA-binding GntR family transcriptional regulator